MHFTNGNSNSPGPVMRVVMPQKDLKMKHISRRDIITSSAVLSTAAIASVTHSSDDVRSSTDWEAVHVNLTYLKSQHPDIEAAFPQLSALFPRREPNPLVSFEGMPRATFHIQITHTALDARPSWTLIHDKGGSLLLATGTKQLADALIHLNRIAKKDPMNDAEHDAYPKGIPVVVRLPVGVTTSMPTYRVA